SCRTPRDSWLFSSERFPNSIPLARPQESGIQQGCDHHVAARPTLRRGRRSSDRFWPRNNESLSYPSLSFFTSAQKASTLSFFTILMETSRNLLGGNTERSPRASAARMRTE